MLSRSECGREEETKEEPYTPPTITNKTHLRALLEGKSVFVESPYASEDFMEMEENLCYAHEVHSILYGWGSATSVVVPHLLYGTLPFKSDEEGEEGFDVGKATCYFPGKTKVWRDFSKFREAADVVVFAIDRGMSSGMKKVFDALVEKRQAKIILLKLGTEGASSA